ncbi:MULTISPECIES: hypothetical protein [Flavobacteriaceae]|uniref:hypothetical protein n=1 Tax=Flavobacteriaceae TaxID=49546 RepID=UPI0032643C8F
MIPKFGLFTPYTLRFHSEYYNEDANAFLKRCMVMFENMTFVSRREQDNDFIEKTIRTQTNENIKGILEYFKPAEELVTADFISDISFTVKPESNMYYGPNHDTFVNFIKDFLTKKFGFDAHNIQNAKEYEMLDFYATALSADFNYLFQISKKNEEVSALYTELHKDAYFTTYNQNAIIPERVLQKICSLNYFDFAKLSWAEIIELKRSKFISDFRIKFSEWLNDYSTSQNIEEFEKRIDRYIKESNFDFLSRNKPNVKSEVASGILGNIPLPFSIPNPVAIYSSISQVKKEIKLKNEFGWLFFIQEAYEKSR